MQSSRTTTSRRVRRKAAAALAAAALSAPLLLASGTPATAAPSPAKEGAKLARKLVDRTSAEGAKRHLEVFQAIAERYDGNRAAGTKGHLRSAQYAAALLKAAGYDVTFQEFAFTYVETLAERLTVLSPEEREIPIRLMTYTKSTPEGGVEAAVAPVPVDEDESTGCTAEDYASGDYEGKIALIQRGGCTFAEKQAAAAEAGAVAAVVYNNTEGDLNGTLGSVADARIPTGGISQEDGEALAAAAEDGEVRINLEIREFQEERTTPNVIAETPGGDPDNVVMFGAHLDSVTDGPGINDNGSGSAGLLEAALQLAKADPAGRHANKVRFALWSAEELGLQGAEHYVAQLSEEERERIALYLNYDMIASPNYGVFVYDGDDSDGEGAGPGPAGSEVLERDITAFLASRGVETRGTDFDGRSDYGPFIEAGIPSGGTFTGAEGIKTAEEAALWGGTEGEAYDGCYHQACDDLDNIDMTALDLNVKAIAHVLGTYAWDTSAVAAAAEAGDEAGEARTVAARQAADAARSGHGHGPRVTA